MSESRVCSCILRITSLPRKRSNVRQRNIDSSALVSNAPMQYTRDIHCRRMLVNRVTAEVSLCSTLCDFVKERRYHTPKPCNGKASYLVPCHGLLHVRLDQASHVLELILYVSWSGSRAKRIPNEPWIRGFGLTCKETLLEPRVA